MGWNLPQVSVGETTGAPESWFRRFHQALLVSLIRSFVDLLGTEMVLQISNPKLPVLYEEKKHPKNRDHDELPTQTMH